MPVEIPVVLTVHYFIWKSFHLRTRQDVLVFMKFSISSSSASSTKSWYCLLVRRASSGISVVKVGHRKIENDRVSHKPVHSNNNSSVPANEPPIQTVASHPRKPQLCLSSSSLEPPITIADTLNCVHFSLRFRQRAYPSNHYCSSGYSVPSTTQRTLRHHLLKAAQCVSPSVRVSASPTTNSAVRVLVNATFNRLQSDRTPTSPRRLDLTAEKILTSRSLPCGSHLQISLRCWLRDSRPWIFSRCR
jgi:hypothetical protein